jgi:ribosomal protein S18 acetylase RimI-like enzyme
MPLRFSQTIFNRPVLSRETERAPRSSRSPVNTYQARQGLSRVCQTPIAPVRITRATTEHFDAVLALIEEARTWLWTKGTDQWAAPWPDKETRDARIFRGIRAGKTWMVWHGEVPAGTVTIDSQPDLAVWSRPTCHCDLSEQAVYVHRLITAREYAGRGLGADLIGWVARRGRREYGAKWIRIDVWTSNTALHAYYFKLGFERCGLCANPYYPSGALFQKRVPEKSDMSAFHSPLTAERNSTRVSRGSPLSPHSRMAPDTPDGGIPYSDRRDGWLSAQSYVFADAVCGQVSKEVS